MHSQRSQFRDRHIPSAINTTINIPSRYRAYAVYILTHPSGIPSLHSRSPPNLNIQFPFFPPHPHPRLRTPHTCAATPHLHPDSPPTPPQYGQHGLKLSYAFSKVQWSSSPLGSRWSSAVFAPFERSAERIPTGMSNERFPAGGSTGRGTDVFAPAVLFA